MMKRILMLLLFISLGVALVGCVGKEEVATAIEEFCNDNPEALVCTNPDATRDQIVADMFNEAMVEFVDGNNPNFCEDYFSSTSLKTTCENNPLSLLPSDFEDLGDDLTINPLSANNQFEVLTEYYNGSPAYRFTVGVTEVDGVIKFSVFSYAVIENNNNVTDLQLTTQWILEFMVNVINESDDGYAAYCGLYFTGNALTACNNDILDVVPSIYIMYSPVVTEIATNQFTYLVSSFDDLDQYEYTLTFVKDSLDVVTLSEVSYVNIPMFNNLTKATEIINEFIYDINGYSRNATDTCLNYIEPNGSQLCVETVVPLASATAVLESSIVSVGGETFIFEISFGEKTVTLEVEVVLTEFHTYRFRLYEISDDNTTEELVLTKDKVKARLYEMFNTYYNGTFSCSDFFTVNAITKCAMTPEKLFLATEVTDLTILSYDVTRVVVIPYHNYGGDIGYTELFPNYYAEFVIEDNAIKINFMEIYPIPTEDDVLSAVEVWAASLVNDSILSVGFCAEFQGIGDDCETWRDGILVNEPVIETTLVSTTNSYGDLLYRIDVNVDGVVTSYELNIYTLNGSVYEITAVWLMDTPEVIVDPNLITSLEDNQDLMNLFISDYNNQLINDQAMLDKYFKGQTSDIITVRSVVLSVDSLALRSVEIISTDNVFDNAIVVFEYIEGERIQYLKLYYEATDLLDGTYAIFVLLVETNQSVTRSEAETIFDDYITDYLLTNMSNETLTAKYFVEDMTSELSNRYMFLLAGGSMAFDSIVIDENVFLGTYYSYLDGMTSVYEQTFVAYDDGSGDTIMIFIELTLIDEYSSSNIEEQVNSFVKDYLFDEEKNSIYHIVVKEIVEITLNEETVYEVSYYRTSMFQQQLVTWVVSVTPDSNGYLIYEDISFEYETIGDYYVYAELVRDDLEELEAYIINYFNEFYNPVYLSADFCADMYDLSAFDLELSNTLNTMCINSRNTVIADGGSFVMLGGHPMVHSTFAEETPGMTMLTFELVGNGKTNDYSNESMNYFTITLYVDDVTGGVIFATLPYPNTNDYLRFTETMLQDNFIDAVVYDFFDDTLLTSEFYSKYYGIDEATEYGVMRNYYLAAGTLLDYTLTYRRGDLFHLYVEINFEVLMTDGTVEVYRLPFVMTSVNSINNLYQNRLYGKTYGIFSYDQFVYTLEAYLNDYFNPALTDSQVHTKYANYGYILLNRTSDLTSGESVVLVEAYINYHAQYEISYSFLIESGPVGNRQQYYVYFELPNDQLYNSYMKVVINQNSLFQHLYS